MMTDREASPVPDRRARLIIAVVNFGVVMLGILCAAALRSVSMVLSAVVLAAVLVYSVWASRRLRRSAVPDG